jgi:hypothetical protein
MSASPNCSSTSWRPDRSCLRSLPSSRASGRLTESGSATPRARAQRNARSCSPAPGPRACSRSSRLRASHSSSLPPRAVCGDQARGGPTRNRCLGGDRPGARGRARAPQGPPALMASACLAADWRGVLTRSATGRIANSRGDDSFTASPSIPACTLLEAATRAETELHARPGGLRPGAGRSMTMIPSRPPLSVGRAPRENGLPGA